MWVGGGRRTLPMANLFNDMRLVGFWQGRGRENVHGSIKKHHYAAHKEETACSCSALELCIRDLGRRGMIGTGREEGVPTS